MLGGGNSAVNQGLNNGWGNIDIEQVGASALMGAATSWLSGGIGQALAGPISRLTSGISSPILRSAVGGGLSGGASGMVLGTGTSIAEGADVSDVFKGGLNGAMFGISTGAVAGSIKGIYEQQKGDYKVYKGVDGDGKVRYIGITERELSMRFNEHYKSKTNRSFLNYKGIKKIGEVPKLKARIEEQKLINQFGLQKNGGQLYNRINSIRPQLWDSYGIKGYNKFNINYLWRKE